MPRRTSSRLRTSNRLLEGYSTSTSHQPAGQDRSLAHSAPQTAEDAAASAALGPAASTPAAAPSSAGSASSSADEAHEDSDDSADEHSAHSNLREGRGTRNVAVPPTPQATSQMVSPVTPQGSQTRSSASDNEDTRASPDDDDDVGSESESENLAATQEKSNTQMSQIKIRAAFKLLYGRGASKWTIKEIELALEAVRDSGVYTVPPAGRGSKRKELWGKAFDLCHAKSFACWKDAAATTQTAQAATPRPGDVASVTAKLAANFKTRINEALKEYRDVPSLETWETGGKSYVEDEENDALQILFAIYQQDDATNKERAKRNKARTSGVPAALDTDATIRASYLEDPDGENDGRTVVPRSTTPRGSKRPRANTADEAFMSMMAVFVEHTKMKMAMLTKSLESETPSTSKSDDEALVEMGKMQGLGDTIVKKIQERTDAALERIERRMEERMAAQQEVLERLAAAILKHP